MNSTILKEIIFNENVNLSFEDTITICKTNKELYGICKNYSNQLSEKLLKYYKVNYNDPTNFIYIADDIDFNDIKNDKDFKKKAFKLYLKFYYKKKIICISKKITSFPIYPRMKRVILKNNNLTSLRGTKQSDTINQLASFFSMTILERNLGTDTTY